MKLVVLIATEALTVIVVLNVWIPLSKSSSIVSSNLMPMSAYTCLLNVKSAMVPLMNHLKLFPLALQKKFVVVFTGTVRFAGATKISANRQI